MPEVENLRNCMLGGRQRDTGSADGAHRHAIEGIAILVIPSVNGGDPFRTQKRDTG